MYSRARAREPSARHAAEQNTSGLPLPASGGKAPPHTRHSAARLCALLRAGRGGRARAAYAALLRRARLAFRQGSEQYATARFGVPNALPHSLHLARCVRAASLSALPAHRAQ